VNCGVRMRWQKGVFSGSAWRSRKLSTNTPISGLPGASFEGGPRLVGRRVDIGANELDTLFIGNFDPPGGFADSWPRSRRNMLAWRVPAMGPWTVQDRDDSSLLLQESGARPARSVFMHKDAEALVRVSTDRSGHWLLRMTRQGASADPAIDWNSDFATPSFFAP
jgi:hypothetical protein